MPDLGNILFKHGIKNDWIYFGRIAPSKLVEARVEKEPRGDVRYSDSPGMFLTGLLASHPNWRNERKAFDGSAAHRGARQ
jgi:hypothetical protein